MSHLRIHQFHPFSVHRWYHWVILFILLVLLLAAFPRHAGTRTWEVFTTDNSPLVHNWIEAIAFDSQDHAWIATVSGLMEFDDGVWTAYTPENSDLPGVWVSDVAVDHDNRVWAATNAGIAVISGDDWSIYTKENTDSGLKNNRTSAICFDKAGTAWIGTEGSAVCTWDGTLWDWHHYDRVPELAGYWIDDLYCAPNGVVWIATGYGATSYNGTTWTHHDIPVSGVDPEDVVVRSITSDTFGNACAITGYGIWKYGGSGWYAYPVTVGDVPLTGMMSALFDNRHAAIAAVEGLAVEGADGWELYTAENSPLPGNSVTTLATGPDGRLWIGTVDGLAVMSGSDTAVEQNAADTPQPFLTTLPPYPNPFNSATVIPFELSDTAPVSIDLFSLTGQHVRTLVNGIHAPDSHTVMWDGADSAGISVPAGLYLYRITASGHTATGKVVLVK